MKYLFYVLKGILFGISNLIPGVSGGTIAVITGVYEKLLYCINNLFKRFLKAIAFLIPYGIGILLAIVFGSKGIDYCIDNWRIPTISLFIGLIVGGIPVTAKPLKGAFTFANILFLLLAFFIVLLFVFIPMPKNATISELNWQNYIIIFICAFFAAVAMVVPGISGMMIFMLFGYYDVIMDMLGGITNLSSLKDNIIVVCVMASGIIIGIFTAAKVFSSLLKKYANESHFMIVGFVLASIVTIVLKEYRSGSFSVDLTTWLISAGLLVVGSALTFLLSKVSKPEHITDLTNNEKKKTA